MKGTSFSYLRLRIAHLALKVFYLLLGQVPGTLPINLPMNAAADIVMRVLQHVLMGYLVT